MQMPAQGTRALYCPLAHPAPARAPSAQRPRCGAGQCKEGPQNRHHLEMPLLSRRSCGRPVGAWGEQRRGSAWSLRRGPPRGLGGRGCPCSWLYHPSPQPSTCVQATWVWCPLNQDKGPSQPSSSDLWQSSRERASGSLPTTPAVLPGAPVFPPTSFSALTRSLLFLSLVGNGMGLEHRQNRLQVLALQLTPASWPWANHPTFLNPSGPICKLGKRAVPAREGV